MPMRKEEEEEGEDFFDFGAAPPLKLADMRVDPEALLGEGPMEVDELRPWKKMNTREDGKNRG